MKRKPWMVLSAVLLLTPLLGCSGCSDDSEGTRDAGADMTTNDDADTTTKDQGNDPEQDGPTTQDAAPSMGDDAKVIFLHHSTGGRVWNGGVSDWFDTYNSQNSTQYSIEERAFPKDSPYGWKNYPYDYWNIWVDHAGDSAYMEEPTLEMLTPDYDVIVFKHCYPVSGIKADDSAGDIESEQKTIPNYKLQYNALKTKMREFPNTRFIVWTGAAQVENSTNSEQGQLAREFFTWVKNEWDTPGDNIFVWDFFELETEGGLYLKDEYADSPSDSHPNDSFSQTVAPLFAQRVVNVIEGKGDTTSLTGE